MSNATNYLKTLRVMDGVVSIADQSLLEIRVGDSRIKLHEDNLVNQRPDQSWYMSGYKYPDEPFNKEE